MHLVLAVLLGALIGLSLGAIGGGGSILTVPILVYIMGQDAHAATATSLAVVGATALIGAIPHWRAGRVAVPIALAFGFTGIAGAFAGAWANHLLPGWLILTLFGLLMLAVSLRMLRSSQGKPPASEQVAARAARGTGFWRVAVAGLGVGLMTGFFGVGGGFLVVPALVLVIGMGMRAAVGTSLLIIALNSASALLAHLRYGGMDIALVLLFVAGGSLGAVLGARLSGRLNERRLQLIFAVFVAGIGLWLVVANLLLAHHIA